MMSSVNADIRRIWGSSADVKGDRQQQNKTLKTTPNTTPELRHVVETPDPNRYGRWLEVPIEIYKGQQTSEAKALGSAIIFRQKIALDGVILKEQVEIYSQKLRIFFSKLKHHDREISLETTPILFRKPYRPLFFLLDDIRHEASSDTDPLLSVELQILLTFIESRNGLKDVIEKYEMLMKNNKVSFDILWTLFPPLEPILYHTDDDAIKQIYRVETVYKTISAENQWVMIFDLLRIHHNGTTAGICRERLMTPYFYGTLKITPENLPIIPLSRLGAQNRSEVEKELIDRGRRYIQIQGQKFSTWDYQGVFWYAKEETVEGKISFGEDKLRLDTRGRVIVDANAARETQSITDPQIIYPSYARYLASFESTEQAPVVAPDPEDSDSDIGLSHISRSARRLALLRAARDNAEAIVVPNPASLRAEEVQLSDDDYMMCPTRTDAFLLDKKIWIWVCVGSLKPVIYYPDPFKALQLPREKKELIKNLVKRFSTANPFAGFDDVVSGKGKGLIFLLHGKPGLGKTFTAETIAEQTKRPLYHVTTGQLSVDVKTLEGELGDIFKLGWRWNAVVLIDEADVLMSKRDHDLARSAIVAVFLRMIEYYQGLLFLTTNREGEFDLAFKNRIHVTIEYPDLGPVARSKIWENLLTKKKDAINLDKTWSEVEYSWLGNLECNGRDIRNIIRTAYGLAASRERLLSVRHLLRVLRERDSLPNAKEVIGKLELIARRSPSIPLPPKQQHHVTFQDDDQAGNGSSSRLFKDVTEEEDEDDDE